MRMVWCFLGRFYQVRARRAERRAVILRKRAEKFFMRIKGAVE